MEPRARAAGQPRSTELERIGRLRRFLSPQLADLVVDSGDESFLESHRREIVVVFCDLRGFTPFAETAEPEEVMGVLGEYHAALGDLVFRFEGTLERFTGDGLMVFFNDPLPCEDAPVRAVRMAVAMRDAGAGPGREVDADGPRPRLRRRHRPGVRDARPDRVRGPLRLRRDRQRDQPGGAAVRRGRPWQILVTQRVHVEAEDIVVGEPSVSSSCAASAGRSRAFDIRGLDAAG